QHQVQGEVARPGADLERALVALVKLRADQLAQLAEHLRLADLAEVDSPLGVIARGRDVVVARVDVADLIGSPQSLHGDGRLPCRPMSVNAYVQENQPSGVPPLELTGERTLPDVPAENYWYRRHLVVYEWIGARVLGARVIDMACGEGYGAEVLSRSAATVVGVDANPEAHAHAGARYVRE